MPRLLEPPLREFTREEKLEELEAAMSAVRKIFRHRNVKREVAERRIGILMSIARDYGWQEMK